MAKTHKELVLDYLWSIAPETASNAQIRQATGIASQQSLYMLTQDLMQRGLIVGEQVGREWHFGVKEDAASLLASPGDVSSAELNLPGARFTGASFEIWARNVLQLYYGVPLQPGKVGDVPKLFDYVSPDCMLVGDAKYFTRVQGQYLPPAKFSVIAEYVWLLEKTEARECFLVFGHDREVPQLWLARYGRLLSPKVKFYFLADDDNALLEEFN